MISLSTHSPSCRQLPVGGDSPASGFFLSRPGPQHTLPPGGLMSWQLCRGIVPRLIDARRVGGNVCPPRPTGSSIYELADPKRKREPLPSLALRACVACLTLATD